jgi:hypothetical protein
MTASELQHPRHPPRRPPETKPCLDTYVNIGQGRRRPSHLSFPRLPKKPLFDKILQTGIVGDDHMMMGDTDSDEIAGISLKVDHAARRE